MRLEQKLIILRKRHGLTQSNVAEKLIVSRQAISRWESGVASPTIENLKGLSSLYGVSVDMLLNEQGESTCQVQHEKTEDDKILIAIMEHKKILLLYFILFLLEAIPGTVVMMPGYPNHSIIEKYSYMDIEPAIRYNCAPFFAFVFTISCLLLFFNRIFYKKKTKMLKINKSALIFLVIFAVVGVVMNLSYSGLFAKFVSILMLVIAFYLCRCEFIEIKGASGGGTEKFKKR